jgi:streptogramin lyase
VYAFDRDGFLWLGSPQRYVLHKVDVAHAFDTVLTASREYSRRLLSEPERRLLEPIRSRLERSFGASVAARLPEHAPAFTSMTVDDRGLLWIARYGAADGATRDFDVFDADGRFVARAQTNFDVRVNPASRAPQSPTPIIIHGNDFYALRHHSNGLDYVVWATIRRR